MAPGEAISAAGKREPLMLESMGRMGALGFPPSLAGLLLASTQTVLAHPHRELLTRSASPD